MGCGASSQVQLKEIKGYVVNEVRAKQLEDRRMSLNSWTLTAVEGACLPPNGEMHYCNVHRVAWFFSAIRCLSV